jgi:uncharacterized protein
MQNKIHQLVSGASKPSPAELETKDASGYTPLRRAVLEGDHQRVKDLLAQGANIHATSIFHGDAVHLAASEGHAKILQTLLENGGDVDSKDSCFGAVKTAAEQGHIETLKMLITAGADLETPDTMNFTPLMCAVDHIDALAALINAGVNVNYKTEDGLNAMIIAAGKKTPDAVNLLRAAGADVHVQRNNGETALSRAQKHGCAESVQALLQEGARPGTAGSSSNATTGAILREGVDIRSSDFAQFNAQEIVKLQRKISTLEAIINTDDKGLKDSLSSQLKADIGAELLNEIAARARNPIGSLARLMGTGSSMRGYTPLTNAVFNGDHQGVKDLIARKVDLYEPSSHGTDALFLAACGGHGDIASTLIRAGASIHYRRPDGGNAISDLQKHGRHEAVQLLVDANARNMNSPD